MGIHSACRRRSPQRGIQKGFASRLRRAITRGDERKRQKRDTGQNPEFPWRIQDELTRFEGGLVSAAGCVTAAVFIYGGHACSRSHVGVDLSLMRL